jgi:hypothetical protein
MLIFIIKDPITTVIGPSSQKILDEVLVIGVAIAHFLHDNLLLILDGVDDVSIDNHPDKNASHFSGKKIKMAHRAFLSRLMDSNCCLHSSAIVTPDAWKKSGKIKVRL